MDKHPIIANGEVYAEPVSKMLGGGPKRLPREYPEAKIRMIDALNKLTQEIETGKERFLEDKVVCIRLEPKFEAKSYVPISIINAMNDNSSALVGGRKYSIVENDDELFAKLYFVRTTDTGLRHLLETLQNGTKDSIEQWRQQVQSINTINLLHPEEKIMGFSSSWEEGTVEFVLHPLPEYTENEISLFFETSGIDATKARVKTYEDGITFISADCSLENMQRIKDYNPLRAAHPMGTISITQIRGMKGSSCPSVYPSTQIPDIHVGVFDGGADDTLPILKKYVTAIDATSEPSDDACVSHGSGVCSAILYGNLAGLNGKDVLEPPCALIDCYRVLPLQNKKDFDLYEVIDLIESIVPNSPHTKLYNLSMGPKGAIVDDSISRFTYALDKLTYEVAQDDINPLFVVAVGNDGELPPLYNRIQSPSDLVNGLGIGSFTYNCNGEKTVSSYSCVGPGREGGKTKPDLLEFGGSIEHPFIIPDLDHLSLCATAGTSFSAPVVTGKIGKLLAMSDSISPHLARALLIHNAQFIDGIPRNKQGFGLCPDNVADLLECRDNFVTVMYSGTIIPTQFLQLPVFAPRINEMHGNVTISWTIATVVAPYSNDPDAYTNNCIEDVFYPHSMIYTFSKQGQSSQKINLLDPAKIPMIRNLIDTGYRQSSMPVSHPAKVSWEEADLRAVDLKWDTIIHKELTMRSSSLFDPSLTIHALGRNGFENESIRYYVIVTINAPRYDGRLYDAILQNYQNLLPIEVRNINRILV